MRLAKILALFLVIGCGLQSPEPIGPVPGPTPIDPVRPDKKEIRAVIALFGAPPCGPCKAALPEVQQHFDALPEDVKKGILIRLYVPTGRDWLDAPTQEIADIYRDALKLKADAIPDPKWKQYGVIMEGSRTVPAGAVLSPDGKVLEKFRAGVQFVPSEIVKSAAAR